MSITELLGAEFWPRAAAVGYSASALAWLIRIALVPASFAPTGRLAVWREGAWLLVALCWAAVGAHWAWLSIDPGLDRGEWSEGLTPWSTQAGWLVGVPPCVDLFAWWRLRHRSETT